MTNKNKRNQHKLNALKTICNPYNSNPLECVMTQKKGNKPEILANKQDKINKIKILSPSHMPPQVQLDRMTIYIKDEG